MNSDRLLQVWNSLWIFSRLSVSVCVCVVCNAGYAKDAYGRGVIIIFINFYFILLNPFLLYLTVSRLFFHLIILQTVRLLGRVIRSSQGLYLNTGQHKYRINAYTQQTSMPCVRFEPTIPASERAKTVHALDRSATVTGIIIIFNTRTPMTMPNAIRQAMKSFAKLRSSKKYALTIADYLIFIPP
jgi:hypothetical protein